ncbi:hypothetical protein B0I35DRAFT_8442 [Stachybotrys elegans]|uniref:Uncharacterized protein n=1 Tax=Stachybotrys elegans TaxID=80388 RepID=A0A8K0T659_9HYPO|nr:hypothetical protein B0I35DRAFT_8442 [Stachybotrys elegans]
MKGNPIRGRGSAYRCAALAVSLPIGRCRLFPPESGMEAQPEPATAEGSDVRRLFCMELCGYTDIHGHAACRALSMGWDGLVARRWFVKRAKRPARASNCLPCLALMLAAGCLLFCYIQLPDWHKCNYSWLWPQGSLHDTAPAWSSLVQLGLVSSHCHHGWAVLNLSSTAVNPWPIRGVGGDRLRPCCDPLLRFFFYHSCCAALFLSLFFIISVLYLSVPSHARHALLCVFLHLRHSLFASCSI